MDTTIIFFCLQGKSTNLILKVNNTFHFNISDVTFGNLLNFLKMLSVLSMIYLTDVQFTIKMFTKKIIPYFKYYLLYLM